MQRRAQLLFTSAALMLVWGVATLGMAGSYRFDLSHLVEPGADFYLDHEVDLGMAFKHIDSASIVIEGVFTPGLMRAVGPDGNNPLVPTDTRTLTIVMGDPGTPFYQTPARTWQDMQGLSGEVSFELPFLAPVVSDEPVFYFNPPLVANPDLSFMLDGEFELLAGSSHAVFSLYQVIENPHLEVTSLVLQINGAAVPEPSALFAILTGVGLAGAIRLRRRYL